MRCLLNVVRDSAFWMKVVIIPPARNCEWKWFCASLWWYKELIYIIEQSRLGKLLGKLGKSYSLKILKVKHPTTSAEGNALQVMW